MRHSVTTPAYLFRKALDNLLYALTVDQVAPDLSKSEELEDPFPTRGPTGWLPLYNMVTFRPDISYAAVKRKAVGIWNCNSCRKSIAGGAWTLTTTAAATVRRCVGIQLFSNTLAYTLHSTVRRLRDITEA